MQQTREHAQDAGQNPAQAVGTAARWHSAAYALFSHRGATAVCLVLCSFVLQLLALAIPLFSLQLYDRILPDQAVASLTWLTLGVLICLSIEMALRQTRSAIVNAKGQFEAAQACMIALGRLWRMLPLVGQNIPRAWAGALNPASRHDAFVRNTFLLTLLDAFFVALAFAAMALLSIKVVLSGALIIAVYIASAAFEARRSKPLITQSQHRIEKRDDQTQTLIASGRATGKYTDLQAIHARHFSDLDKAERHIARMRRLLLMPHLVGQGFAEALLLAILTAGVIDVQTGVLSLGGLMAILFLGARMTGPMIRLASVFNHSRANQDVLKTGDVNAEPAPNVIEGRPHFGAYCAVSVRGVRTEKNSQLFSFDVPQGACVHLTNDRDSTPGQLSALLKGISGLAPARCGEILLDGRTLGSIPAALLPATVTLLDGKTHCFDGTIFDNITQNDPRRRAEALALSRRLGLDQHVATLPRGYLTPLKSTSGDGNEATLSGGMRRLISLVGALSAHPSIVVFDNADRGLDQSNYNALYALLALLKGQATLILATDDANLKDLADTRIELGLNASPATQTQRRYVRLPQRLRGLTSR